MESLQQLAINHAYWADRATEMRRKTSEHLDNCARLIPETDDNGDPVFRFNVNPVNNCIDEAVQHAQASDNDLSFEEHWNDMVADGQACTACQQARQAKRERVYAKERLGKIHAAMTRVGRRLAEIRDGEQ